MDTPEIRAAGTRPIKETYDQASNNGSRQTNTYTSNIFGNVPQIQQQQPSIRSSYQKSDIFGTGAQQAIIVPQSRNHNTFQSQIFQYDQPVKAKPNNESQKLIQSTVFEQQTPIKKIFQAKNNEFKHQDHGKDFLFGKTDFNDYKSIKRGNSQAVLFQPKLDYDPEVKKYHELYGTEISKDHLPTNKQTQQRVQTSNVNQKNDQKQNKEFDPSTRNEELLSSNIFHSDEKKTNNQKIKAEPLTATTAKWSTTSQKQINNIDSLDPDSYAKTKKEKELESSIFGKKEKTTKITDPTYSSKQKEINDKKRKDQNQSEVFGHKDQQKQPIQKQERLIASNLDWTKTDTVKNLKDFNPGDDLQSNQEEMLKQTASQKKFQGLTSTLDTHQYQPKPEVELNDRISVKNLKYKGDILSRDEKKVSKQVQKITKTTVIVKEVKQSDQDSVI